MGRLYFAIIMALLTQEVKAWNSQAHMFMATIAYNHLAKNDAVALFWAEDILKLYKDKYTSKNEGMYTFIEAACWADDIKKGKGSWQRQWHFADIPYLDPNADPKEIFLRQDNTLNISRAIPDLFDWLSGKGNVNNSPVVKEIMKNVKGIMEGRSVGLRLLMHYIGDVHQPLHVTEHYSEKFRTGDLGGNLVKLDEKYGATNLH